MSHPTPALPYLEPYVLTPDVAAEIEKLERRLQRDRCKDWARVILRAERDRERPLLVAVEFAKEALFPHGSGVDGTTAERPKEEYEVVHIHNARNALLAKYGYQTIEYRGMRTPGEEG